MPRGVYKRTKPAWNKGLDKNDPRVARNAKSREDTMLKKYGSLSYNNSEKREETNKERYGVENVFQSKELMKDSTQKAKATNMERYGYESAAQNDAVKEKTRNTFLANHPGISSPSQLPGVGDKISISAKSDKVKTQKENTFLDRYGVKYGLQNPGIMEKKLNTTLQRYGVLYYANKEKEYATKKANNSFNTSQAEDKLYLDLIHQYGEDCVVRQYMDERYPYTCDFYIIPEDLFIEYNGTWTHGGHPFDSMNLDDIYKLEQWQEKAKESKYYRNAIYTWTDLDVKKREIAEKNGLNYITIY